MPDARGAACAPLLRSRRSSERRRAACDASPAFARDPRGAGTPLLVGCHSTSCARARLGRPRARWRRCRLPLAHRAGAYVRTVAAGRSARCRRRADRSARRSRSYRLRRHPFATRAVAREPPRPRPPSRSRAYSGSHRGALARPASVYAAGRSVRRCSRSGCSAAAPRGQAACGRPRAPRRSARWSCWHGWRRGSGWRRTRARHGGDDELARHGRARSRSGALAAHVLATLGTLAGGRSTRSPPTCAQPRRAARDVPSADRAHAPRRRSWRARPRHGRRRLPRLAPRRAARARRARRRSPRAGATTT